jgi:hypothetical protein
MSLGRVPHWSAAALVLGVWLCLAPQGPEHGTLVATSDQLFKPIAAAIVDMDGVEHQVTNLNAEYSGPRTFPLTSSGGVYQVLMIHLSAKEGRATVSQDLTIDFYKTRRVVFHGALVPGDLETVFKGTEPIRVENSDGSVLLLSQQYLAEIDPKGKVIRKVQTLGYQFGMGDGFRLDEFIGGTKSSFGKDVHFSIRVEDVRSIEFK